MIIYLNKRANSGRAASRWVRIEKQVLQRFPDAEIVKADDLAYTNISGAISKGETEFISAGGDGTFNSLINMIISCTPEKDLYKIKVGAIGLGSSNDFHKPYSERICGIPVRIDFENTEASDAGVIEFYYNRVFWEKRYWMINSSIGILADANKYFNHRGIMWDYFKRHFVNGAILYSALKTIAQYKNKRCSFSSVNFGIKDAVVSSFGIAKNPNFAGEFSYPGKHCPANGLFSLYLLENMNIAQTILTLAALWKKKGKNMLKSAETDWIEVNSDTQFNVEFDGEVVTTDTARFSIINKAVQLCK